ncbi:HMG box domain-containing protein [Mycena venus]|uniref:HMG box domain-containing protein n=1 Tax=Mycena venus TaxID=2733690 RepID=A0A8H6YDB1_9AGAR|nr:HMG box domain-containing protein [Mycena venus]
MSSSRILGWTPSSPDGDVVDVVPQASLQFTFKLARSGPSSPSMSVAEAPSPPPSVGVLTTPNAQTKKIPRPPNSFIIFRTEYTRLHHNPKGTRSRRDALRDDVKAIASVSRKAGDAWRLLPPEEKQRYQHLAELAKEQHARAHPNYQYRPQRHKTSGARRTLSVPKRRLPSPTLTIRTVSDTQTIGSSVEQPPSSPGAEDLPPAVDPTVKADRRRSSSVPVTLGEHQFTSAFLPEERWERPERPTQTKRRSRSVTQDWVSLAPSLHPQESFFDPRSPQNAVFSQSFYPPFLPCSPHAHLDTVDPSTLFTPAQHMSPLAAVASSLAGWNGAVPSPSSTPLVAPIAPQPMYLSPPSWLATPETVLAYGTAASPCVVSPIPLPADQWPLDPAGHYVFGVPTGWDALAHEHLKAATDPEDYARAAALQEYEHGLQERVHGVADPNADFNFFGVELDFDPSAELEF